MDHTPFPVSAKRALNAGGRPNLFTGWACAGSVITAYRTLLQPCENYGWREWAPTASEQPPWKPILKSRHPSPAKGSTKALGAAFCER